MTDSAPAPQGVSERSALLLIDLQEAFFEAPGLQEARPRLVEAVRTLAEGARAAEVPIFLISTEHSRDRSTWTLTMRDDDQGFLFHGDPGTEVISELDTAGMTRIEKTRDSAWLGTDLLLRLHNFQVERVYLAGVSTHACVAHTARDAFSNNMRTTVVTDAVGDESERYMAMALELLEADGQADMATIEETLAAWRSAD